MSYEKGDRWIWRARKTKFPLLLNKSYAYDAANERMKLFSIFLWKNWKVWRARKSLVNSCFFSKFLVTKLFLWTDAIPSSFFHTACVMAPNKYNTIWSGGIIFKKIVIILTNILPSPPITRRIGNLRMSCILFVKRKEIKELLFRLYGRKVICIIQQNKKHKRWSLWQINKCIITTERIGIFAS